MHANWSGSGGLISPVLFSLYINDLPPLLHHAELALYADDAAIIVTYRKPTLVVSYLESFLNDIQRWLSEWRIAINVSNSTAVIFALAGRRIIQPRPVTLFREPIEWVETACCLAVTLDTRLTWSPHIDQVRRRAAQWLGILSPLFNRKSDVSVRNGVVLYKQLIRPFAGLCVRRVEVRCPHPCPETTGVAIQVSWPCYWCLLVPK
jgi:hypothetical protein